MNRSIFLLFVVVMLLLIGGVIVFWLNPSPKAIRLELTGTAGAARDGQL